MTSVVTPALLSRMTSAADRLKFVFDARIWLTMPAAAGVPVPPQAQRPHSEFGRQSFDSHRHGMRVAPTLPIRITTARIGHLPVEGPDDRYDPVKAVRQPIAGTLYPTCAEGRSQLFVAA